MVFQQPTIDPNAWNQHPGPIALIAGPGTGKTHQLALRIVDLVIKRSVDPESITVITFTKEAAKNMKQRISDEEKKDVYLTFENRPKHITTMHSLGHGIVREYSESLGLHKNFLLVTNKELRNILFIDAALASEFNEVEAKNANISRQIGDVRDSDDNTHIITQNYEKLLRKNMSIDYDDQILLACKILCENHTAKEIYSNSSKHLLVDEYQDINSPQREFIRLLSMNNEEGLFVVGDDDQSIYSFRGGSPKYIRDFVNEFGNKSKFLSLNKSRRCSDKIILASLNVVEKIDKSRIPKPEPSFNEDKKNGDPILFHNSANEEQEAAIIAKITQTAVNKNQEVLILIPAKQYADSIKVKLRRKNIVYDHFLPTDDSGISQILDLYRWLEFPEDNYALRKCIDFLIKSKAIDIPSAKVTKPEKVKQRSDALKQIAHLWDGVEFGEKTLWDVIKSKAKDKANESNGIIIELYNTLNEISKCKDKDVGELFAVITKFINPWRNQTALINEFQSWRDELNVRKSDTTADVRIMTLQSAKGLEADIVCVVGLTEQIQPRDNLTSEEIVESARLTYVSMTRAKNTLHLFHARNRKASITYIDSSYNLHQSRFIDAINNDYIETKYHQAKSKITNNPR